MDGKKESICPKCGGKKFMKLNLGPFASQYVKCHVCHGEGIVPFKPAKKALEKKVVEERVSILSRAQMKLF